MDTNTANDKNGASLNLGDEVIFRGTVAHLQSGAAMLRAVTTVEMGNREFWFPGAVLERVAQGAVSVEVDRQAAAPAAPIPTPAEGVEISQREQAIAFVMTRDYERAAAERIVEEFGWRHILADRNEQKVRQDSEKARESSPATPATSTAANQQEDAAPGAGDPKAPSA